MESVNATHSLTGLSDEAMQEMNEFLIGLNDSDTSRADIFENEFDLNNITDGDILTGNETMADELADALDSSVLFNNENILREIEADTTPVFGGNDSKHSKQYEPEKPMVIDQALTSGDMLTLIFAEIKKKRIAGHHIDSMNSFSKIGIKQIVTKIFAVEGRMKNVRDKTDEDRKISEIHFRVDFTDINLTPPTTTKYRSGTSQMLTPNMAAMKNLTYSCPMFMDAMVTATAVYHDGGTSVRTAEIKNHRIASIPCQTGTELCNTYNCSRETLKAMGEDPHSTGGSFIVKGLPWVVDNHENITNNTFHVFKNMHMNEIARGAFLSKPGDAFENMYQVLLRYLNNGLITIEITMTKSEKLEIPFYLIFRALGMTRDRDIVDHIVYGVNNTDLTTKKMLEILERAFTVADSKFSEIRECTDPNIIIGAIAAKIAAASGANIAAARKDDNAIKYINTNILSIIDRYIFPHIGTGIEHRTKKLRFFGHLINRLLSVYMGVIDPTDRDSYRSKRVFAAGTSFAKTFKTDFNFAIVQSIKKQLIKDFKSTPFSNVLLADSVKAAINSDDLERMLTQAITSGDKTITIKRNEITNRMSSATLYFKNDLNVKSTLNTINTPNTSASKQNDRADEMRRVHSTYVGFIDISQSADTGEKVGMSKQMACTASVCGASSSFILKRILAEDPDVIPLDKIPPALITERKLTKVFVNGDWIGCCEFSHKFVQKYRTMRRHDDVHHLTTIVWELLIREVYFWTDVGRLMRPLIIVYNNLPDYIAAKRAGKSIKFQQWIKFTKEHVRGLRSGTLTMDDLRMQRVIEYISPEEQENAILATNIQVLKAHSADIQNMYTHCDIDQAIFGIISLASPMANHSNATRITYYTNHRKQSAGWFALNYPSRIDKNVTLQHYCERPLVSTASDALTYPNGHNVIVAIALDGGLNQEDSVTLNQTSSDCGAFNASYYNYEKAELEKNEQFGNPDYARTLDIKKEAIYEYIQNGFVTPGTVISPGHVLIVKAAKIPKPVDQYLYVDKSIVYNHPENAYVENVIVTRNDEDTIIAKVKYRSDRTINIGDKVSTRTGNKGIVCNKIPRCDMMYCEDGMTPDELTNPHSIPTRMAVNQLTECTLAIYAALGGFHLDATSFRSQDFDLICDKLATKHNIKYGGFRRVYSGCTGEWKDCLIFIGPTTLQRLQKFVIDEHYATRDGPTSAVTHQPLDGKMNNGGLRIGEMEKDVIVGHGTMRALHEKFYEDSDGVNIYICRCGERAIVNEKLGLYKCRTCGDLADIAKVPSSWSSNLFMSESNAMNAHVKFGLTPHTFANHQPSDHSAQ